MLYIQLATLAVLTLTLWASKQMLEVNTRPQVECYLRSRPDRPNVFELAVANFGKGAAKNLEIELIGVDEADFSTHSVQLSWRTKGPFALLGPGESITSLFGFGPSLVGNDREPLKPFKIGLAIGGRHSALAIRRRCRIPRHGREAIPRDRA